MHSFFEEDGVKGPYNWSLSVIKGLEVVSGIYVIFQQKKNQLKPIYVGMSSANSISIRDRLLQHFNNPTEKNGIFIRMDKPKFAYIDLSNLTKEEIRAKETYLIEKLGTKSYGNSQS